MQVEATAALAPVLARFAIVVDGPLEADVVVRLAEAGSGRATLSDLAASIAGRPGTTTLAEAVAVARAVVARLVAAGAIEAIAGGYRIADPQVAAAVQQVVMTTTAPASPRPATAVPAAVGTLSPTTVPLGAPIAPATVPSLAPADASRVLQHALAARLHAPPPAAPPPAPTLPPVALPSGAWQELVAAGWVASTTDTGAVTLTSPPRPDGGVVHLAVADAATGPARAAPALSDAATVHLTSLTVTPLSWGRADPDAAGRVAGVLQALTPAGARVLVVDRSLVPALVLSLGPGGTPGAVVVDLRSAPAAVSSGRAIAPDVLAAVMAGAAATEPPRRRRSPPTGSRATGDLLAMLFGAAFATALYGPLDTPPDPIEDAAPSPHRVGRGAVVTGRRRDPQADALAELLGVEVVLLAPGEDLGPEVLAWLDDDAGSTLLPPHA